MEAVTLTVTLTKAEIDLLWAAAMDNFINEQPERFSLIGETEPLTVSPMEGGRLYWHTSASDALLFGAAVRALGHMAFLLSDEVENGDLVFATLTNYAY